MASRRRSKQLHVELADVFGGDDVAEGEWPMCCSMIAWDWKQVGSKEVEEAASVGKVAFVKAGVEAVGDAASMLPSQEFRF